VNAPTRTIHAFTAVVLAAALLGLSLLAALWPVPTRTAEEEPVPEHVQELHMVDTTRQHRAHLVLMALAGATVLALAVSRRARASVQRLDDFLRPRAPSWRWETAASLAIITLSCLPKPRWPVIALAGTLAMLIAARRRGQTRWFGIALGLALAGFALMVQVPGLLLPIDLAQVPNGLAEAHYGAVVSTGDRLARGLRLFSSFSPNYGLLEPQILGGLEQPHGLWTFLAHFRMIQWTQVAFSILAFLCYWKWSGKRILPTALVMIPILSLAYTRQFSIFFPNQSGWRFCGLPAGMLILISMRGRGLRSAAWLGLGLGGLLMFNPETGIALAFGYALFLFPEYLASRTGGKVALTAAFALSAVLIPLISAIAFKITFGYFPLPSPSSEVALVKFAGGYGGLKLYFGIAWIVMLVHAVIELVRSAASIRSLTRRRRIRMSLAATILVWYAYFINRPHEWNLWTVYFLYGFFVVDLLRTPILSRYVRVARSFRLAAGLAVILMFTMNNAPGVANAAMENIHAVRHRHEVQASLESSSRMLSGVWMPRWYADLTEQRAALVASRAAAGPVTYFTGNVYLTPILTGAFSNLPVSDPYESYSAGDFERLAHWIESHHIRELLFDDPATAVIGSSERQHYFGRLKARLARTYRLLERRDGWEIWGTTD
jgi:hypothetical protein